MKRRPLGFSIIEVMMVIAIVSILTSVIYVNMRTGTAQSRDAERQADIRTLQTAIELYKNKYGRYPARCANSQPWSGQTGTQYACNSGNQYITGLAPEFIQRLPEDPKLNGNDSGYVYTVNTAGTVFKLMARRTVETENVDYGHPFQSCDANNQASTVPLCNQVHPSNNKPNHCRHNNAIFDTTYGVWGGYAVPTTPPSNSNYDVFVERLTEDVVCEIP